jgi:hypothetical protein
MREAADIARKIVELACAANIERLHGRLDFISVAVDQS